MTTSREVLLIREGAEILGQAPGVPGTWQWMKQKLCCINHYSSMNFHANLSTPAIFSPRFLINPGLPLQFQTFLTEVRSFGLVCRYERCQVLKGILLEENFSVRRYLAPNPHPGLQDHLFGCTKVWGRMTCTEGLFDGWRIWENQQSKPFHLQFSEKLHDFECSYISNSLIL